MSKAASVSLPLASAVPKPSIVRLVGALVGGNLAALSLRMVGGLVTARIVEPSTMGLFSGLSLFLGYAPFLQLGILNGLNRELPYYVGKGDHQRVKELAAAAQSWAILVGSLVAAGALVVAAYHLTNRHWMLGLGWLNNAVNVWLLFYVQYYLQMTYRSAGDFARVAKASVIQQAVSLLLVGLVWWLDFYGLCLRGLLATLANAAFLFYWRPLKVQPAWNRSHFLHLLKIGGPIFVVGQLYAWWTTVDGTLLFTRMGAHGMGLYTLAALSGGTLQMLPEALGVVLYPRMAEQYGRGANIRGLLEATLKPLIIAAMVLAGMAVLAWFLIPLVVPTLLPNYTEGIQAAQWSLICPVVLCLAPVGNILNVLKKQIGYGVIIGLGMVSYYGSLQWLLRDGLYLAAFPQAMLLGRSVFVAGCYLYVGWLLKQETHPRCSAPA